MNINNTTINEQKCKLFVGNVPYQCTKSEFKKCFENIKGFVDADIIVKHNSTTSRGFGFVTFDTTHNADSALKKNDVMFKDRILRLSKYNVEIKKNVLKPTAIFLKNILENTTRDDIYNTFSAFGKIDKCFINSDFKTGKLKNSAVVKLYDETIMDYMVNNMKTVELINGNVVNMYSWNNKILFDKYLPKNKYDDIKEYTHTINNIRKQQNNIHNEF